MASLQAGPQEHPVEEWARGLFGETTGSEEAA